MNEDLPGGALRQLSSFNPEYTAWVLTLSLYDESMVTKSLGATTDL